MAKKWKSRIENAIADEYPGTTIKWDGDNPTLVVPDEFESRANEIVEYVTAVWSSLGGEVKFYSERAVHTAG